MTREEAIYRLKNTAWLGTHDDVKKTEQAIEMAIEALSVEVVRCKDCKHYDYHHPSHEQCIMWKHAHIKPNVDYCSYGERRSDETD